MRFSHIVSAAALTAVVYAQNNNKEGRANGGNAGAAAAAGGQGATGTTLLANAIQSGSFNDGSNEIGADEAAQAKSLTSQNNFINNCAGKTLTNGLQVVTGSCNGIPMGDIPAKTAMVSSVITFPPTGGQPIASDTTFNISVQVNNLVAGSFTNADATYYAAPQFLQGGKIVGHTHVTVQDLGKSLNPTTALDPTQFAFFKGINDAGNGQGLLQAVVTGGLPAGNYRVCTMASASNHQPVLMPVAQRGTPDDCTKFVVNGNGKTINVAANNGQKGIDAAAAAASAVVAGPNVADPAIAAASASAAAAAKAGNKGAAVASGAASANKAGTGAAAAASGAASANKAGAGAAAATGAAKANKAGAGVAAATGAAKAGQGQGQNGAKANAGQGQAQTGAKANAGQGQGQNGTGRKQKARREFIA